MFDKLYIAVIAALKTPAVVEAAAKVSLQVVGDTPEVAEKKLVEEAGSNMDCLLKVIVWLKDQRDSGEFDRIYRTYFSSQETLPARTRMQAGRTPMDCGLEVEAIGYVPKAAKAKAAKRTVKKAVKKKPAVKGEKKTATGRSTGAKPKSRPRR